MHDELLSIVAEGPGLTLVTGSTGNGKTTAIEAALADARCPAGVAFVGDIRGEVSVAQRAIELAHSAPVIGVLRIPRAAGAFRRLLDLGISPTDVIDVAKAAFTTRLFRKPTFLLVHERLIVTPPIRRLILTGADEDAIHRQAMADGMRSLRQAALEHAANGRLSWADAELMTPDD